MQSKKKNEKRVKFNAAEAYKVFVPVALLLTHGVFTQVKKDTEMIHPNLKTWVVVRVGSITILETKKLKLQLQFRLL